jgi:NAD(P)-dependent dehydrogenase (short-subunit alcohol dehydrogenase family)
MTHRKFDLSGTVAVVTGGYGVLGGSIAEGLAASGAKTAILGRDPLAARRKVQRLSSEGYDAIALQADVTDVTSLRDVADTVMQQWGRVDVLVNAAGGNVPEARTDDIAIFEVPPDAFERVVRLNLHGTVHPTLVFGEIMARQRSGSIINISSMASVRMLSGVAGYSAAKAAVDNFTRWMAVELAEKYGPGLRVNAIAPGFFLAKQNEAVLRNSDGTLTDRSRRIMDHTPMRRFGHPEDLQGVAIWLASPESAFVTGTVIPVDGGFSAASGI